MSEVLSCPWCTSHGASGSPFIEPHPMVRRVAWNCLVAMATKVGKTRRSPKCCAVNQKRVTLITANEEAGTFSMDFGGI